MASNAESETPRRRITVPAIRDSKVRNGDDPLVMVTAYDAPMARIAEEAEVDLILVGDSLGMVVLGHSNTLEVTVDDMVHHIKAVARTRPKALVVADMPWMSFHVSPQDTLINAARLIRAGGKCLKIEGGTKRIPMMEAVIAAEMPVIAHLGLTPQSFNAMGGFKIQAREAEAANELVREAKAVEAAGCFAVLLEGVPDVVGQMVTDALSIPTIGIGAGPACDGQVLVYHDIIGLENRFKPKFVRRFGTAYEDQLESVQQYAQAVRHRTFPAEPETYVAREELTEALGLYGSKTQDS
ncbi:MAG: 3-methyl-2-oxobutanoate hydroxymethyltransferase [Acidimicrobiales bacterium]|nr:3-methyl-2-oxobutanoate hydroxymethyltransferase [Acidimicrobiales bacterium]